MAETITATASSALLRLLVVAWCVLAYSGPIHTR
jgi:hypothetical protein